MSHLLGYTDTRARTHTQTHCGVNQQTSPVDNCAHKAAVNKDTCLRVCPTDPNKQTEITHTHLHRHTHIYALSLHCRHNSQAWLCASLIPLTMSERHVNQRGRLPAQPYMSLSFSLSLLLSLSLCFYLHPFFTLVKPCFSTSTTLAYFSFASCSCSSFYPITANHVFLNPLPPFFFHGFY